MYFNTEISILDIYIFECEVHVLVSINDNPVCYFEKGLSH